MSQRESPSASASSQVLVDRVEQADLLGREPGEDLHVARLVHGLGGGVELRVDVGHRFDDPPGHGQRALLAVQELAEEPGRHVVAELVPFGLVQLLVLARAVDRGQLLGRVHDVRVVNRLVPVDPLGGVPLLVLTPLVQVEQALPPVAVLPGEPRGTARRHIPRLR